MSRCILVTERQGYYFMTPDQHPEEWDSSFENMKVLEVVKIKGWVDWKYAVKIKIDENILTYFIDFIPNILLNEYNEIISSNEADDLIDKTDSFFKSVGEGINRLCPRHTSVDNNGGWAGACYGCVDIDENYCTHEGDYKKRYGDCISLREFILRFNRKI